ncbi:small subunit ribosomal protein S17 [Bathymodiolus platifrons methanotrophic gill symbiont]|uniref:30S ribosomal protein S17 n=1 Tax=Bathymodiolus platifrons methanotrophic gill symbiont TaxID=113268 RepID=UPI000B420160|nr:30S ribosomal protein S17 [Bathymodiolus platifrons methanotrophic gill symbiont]MCK5869085.1 30S ribosomal protein S17 [Methyloprofundus sp.]TXK97422.1 30S ribosomal protein S17 [Methylococcaceae bacterium CS4]TXK99728.1 30S ribosomal protein S17 [Methylococcaceae bacterium CS5]TXL01814.1 30S ribosomal protein S17 [Methylococcaceae bacterium HT1]TXL06592.1 30S ribosomal protein S17 [Methylococcaceae bacterium CS1]TXL09533.1 30S ribosomal protein S17 [Methylococcaceae bacterium CS3]TXL121
MSDNTEQVRTITGRVVSNKMDKTITVLVERLVKHRMYGKYIRRSTKMFAHDENNVCNEGDVVTITSCRPYSKNKSFKLVEVVK